VVPSNPLALATNVRVNSPPAFWTQSEVGLASIGRTVVAAWNDGTQPVTTGSLAFSWSTDGGHAWHASRPLPLGDGLISWESDPVMVADPSRGEFWFAALAIASQPPANAVAVLRGTVTDTGFVWTAITLPRASRDTLPDKPWLAIDPLTGRAA